MHADDSFICPHQIAEIGGSSDNPYRAYILPLAQKQIGLLYAVLGLSASHLGQMTEDSQLHQDVAVEYRMRAIRALSEEIRKSQEESLSEDEQDAVFAIIQILLLHDVWPACPQGKRRDGSSHYLDLRIGYFQPWHPHHRGHVCL